MGASKKDWWLSVLNMLMLGVLRAVNRVKRSWESYSRSLKSPIHFSADYSSRTAWLFIELPRSRPIFYSWYISTQEWYLTPSKILPKIRKLRKIYRKYSVPNQDGFMAIIAKRSTSGARAAASAVGIPVLGPDRAVEIMKIYFAKRYDQLVDSLRGKRIYGELVFLVAMLQEIAREFMERVREVLNLDYLERYAETGFTVPRDIGPPLGTG